VNLEWTTVARLSEEVGPAFYVFDTEALRRNVAELRGAFASVYANSGIAYSLKANYLPSLVRLAAAEGCLSEVVSRFEYDMARSYGIPAADILFNGPHKQPDEIALPLLEGAVLNLDSTDELEDVLRLAAEHRGVRFRVGVRCNFDVPGNKDSRLGLDSSSGELAAALDALAGTPNVTITGLHCHHSTRERSVASFAFRTRELIALYDRFLAGRCDVTLNVGGGFFGRMPPALQRQFGMTTPSYAEYGHAVAGAFRERFGEAGPRLLIEPGAALVADTMAFVAKVLYTKSVRGRHVAQVSGSVYRIKPTLHDKNLPMRVLRVPGREASPIGPIDVVGYTCMETDVLFRGFEDGRIDKGDFVAFDNVGAYGVVLQNAFIRQPCAVVRVDGDNFALEKRAETLSDFIAPYAVSDAALPVTRR
jgi:diaminopimelate decarboxylase